MSYYSLDKIIKITLDAYTESDIIVIYEIGYGGK